MGGHPLELLNDLAERALRPKEIVAPFAGRDAIPPESSAESAAQSSAISRDTSTLAPSAAAATPAMSPRGLAASGEPAQLDAGTLADLVNEALVEQARRHGVDLS